MRPLRKKSLESSAGVANPAYRTRFRAFFGPTIPRIQHVIAYSIYWSLRLCSISASLHQSTSKQILHLWGKIVKFRKLLQKILFVNFNKIIILYVFSKILKSNKISELYYRIFAFHPDSVKSQQKGLIGLKILIVVLLPMSCGGIFENSWSLLWAD